MTPCLYVMSDEALFTGNQWENCSLHPSFPVECFSDDSLSSSAGNRTSFSLNMLLYCGIAMHAKIPSWCCLINKPQKWQTDMVDWRNWKKRNISAALPEAWRTEAAQSKATTEICLKVSKTTAQTVPASFLPFLHALSAGWRCSTVCCWDVNWIPHEPDCL